MQIGLGLAAMLRNVSSYSGKTRVGGFRPRQWRVKSSADPIRAV